MTAADVSTNGTAEKALRAFGGKAHGWTLTVTPHEAKIVLNVNGFESCRGYASEWEQMLCQLVLKADRAGRARLRLAFPEMVDAVDLFTFDGTAAIQSLAATDGSTS